MYAPHPSLGPNTRPTKIIDIADPAEVHEGGVVEARYPEHGLAGAPVDSGSADRMEAYLGERLVPPLPEADTLTVYEPSVGRRLIPRIIRVRDGDKEVRRLEMDGWILPPKVAAVATAVGLLLGPAIAAVGDAKDEIGVGVHNIARIFNPNDPYIEMVEQRGMEPGPTITLSKDVTSVSTAGRVFLDRSKFEELVDKAIYLRKNGGEITGATVKSGSSDEYGADNTIGVAEPPEQDLADERSEGGKNLLMDVANKQGLNLPDIKVATEQDVLSPALKERAILLANENGFATITEAIIAVESGNQVSPKLEQFIAENFTKKRFTKVSLEVDMPGEPVEVIKLVPREVVPEDQRPEDPNRDHPIFPILIPPIPRLRRYTMLKDKFRWALDRTKTVLIPRVIENMHDKAWVRLLPRALQPDDKLVDHPWKDTRKYLHLLRENLSLPLHPKPISEGERTDETAEDITSEDMIELKSRIGGVLRADYEQENGEEASARMMFVDHVPSADHLEAYSMFMKVLASLQGGKVGLKIPDIFVFPSSSAGTEHGDPRKIALGVDEQNDSNVLGLCTPILGLVELHVPMDINGKDLETELYKYMGPIWVLAHEVAGHGADAVDEKLQLLPVRARGVANAHIPLGTSWKDGLGDVGSQLEPLLGRDFVADPVRFKAVFDFVDGYGEPVTVERVITGNDPLISHARSLQIVGSDPTRYAGVNGSEQYAETAAQVVTSTKIPGEEAGADIQPQIADNGEPAAFATGYSADESSAEEYRRSVGALPGISPLTFAQFPRVTTVLTTAEADPLIGKFIKQARETEIPLPHEMIAILSELRSRSR